MGDEPSTFSNDRDARRVPSLSEVIKTRENRPLTIMLSSLFLEFRHFRSFHEDFLRCWGVHYTTFTRVGLIENLVHWDEA